MNDARLRTFERDGFVKLERCVPAELIDGAAKAFDDVWDTCEAAWRQALDSGRPPRRQPAMTHPECVRFLDCRDLLAAPRELIGDQLQLVNIFPIYQEPRRSASGKERTPRRGWLRVPERGWHRDFSFTTRRGDVPVLVTLIVFLDDVGEEQGPTVVLPRSHLEPGPVAGLETTSPHPDEVPVPLSSGDALLLNGAVLHSHSRNRSAAARRGLVLMFAYWWVKPHSWELPLPEAALADAPADRRRLLGVEQPADDLFMY